VVNPGHTRGESHRTGFPNGWNRHGILAYSSWQTFKSQINDTLGAETNRTFDRENISAVSLPPLEDALRSQSLLATFRRMRRTAGLGAGPDGIGPRDVAVREIAGPIRRLYTAVRAGTYRPMPTRSRRIPKEDGRWRSIRIGTLLDRVLGSALNTILTPFIDRTFLEGSYGFRPGRSHHHAQAAVVAAVEREKVYIVTADDVRGAFDHVLAGPLLEDVDRVVPDPDYRRLLSAVVRGPDGNRREAIDQGGALGPLLLNVYLHHRHDLAMAASDPPRCWVRYADNLLYVTRTVTDGLAALDRARELLSRVDLALKGDPGVPVDIREQPARVLGLDLRCNGDGISYAVPADAWDDLADLLTRAHEEPNPPALAMAVLAGWTYACAPAVGNYPDASAYRVYSLAREYGFGGTTSYDRIRYGAVVAGGRWEGLLASARGRSDPPTVTSAGPVTAATPPDVASPPVQPSASAAAHGPFSSPLLELP
jgi:Reverse transcriptase (RNA-dependent DNA polymerase)